MKFHDELNSPGIYKIVNILNNKLYLGSTINLKKRWHNHYRGLKAGKGINKILQNAWNKYGENNFNFEVLEIIEGKYSEDKLRDILIEKEQYWVDKLNPDYNVRKKCVSSNIGAHWNLSNSTKEKMRGRKTYTKNVVLLD